MTNAKWQKMNCGPGTDIVRCDSGFEFTTFIILIFYFQFFIFYSS